ncbi:MAG: glycoside hydrolase family 95-like protein, partial [Bacteroidota bacterium]
TLEGNFAFAQGLQEMLIQSGFGYIEVLPAVPEGWRDVSFTDLRCEGAFLVSLQKKSGTIEEIKIKAPKGGIMRLKLPFKTFYIGDKTVKYSVVAGMLSINMKEAQIIVIKNGHV